MADDNIMSGRSEFPGVGKNKHQWAARTHIGSQRIWLGRHDDELAAARAIRDFWSTWITIETARRSLQREAEENAPSTTQDEK